ncbi:MAG TPA: hypothetical protein VF288_06850 [Mycobacteriales bacterium]
MTSTASAAPHGGPTSALPEGGAPSAAVLTVVVYSSAESMRSRVRTGVGVRPVTDLGPIDWVEVSDGAACIATVDVGGIDAVVLDGEAWPEGGFGLARQIKDEYADPPATVLLVARRDDRWLSAWSRADATVPYPVDPFVLTEALVALLRARQHRQLPAPKPRKSFGIRVHGDE